MPSNRFISGGPAGEAASPPTIGAAVDPEQSLAAGTTTATVEWPAATGGTAPLTYNLSVKDEAGSSVTPNSGSAQGPYVIPVADGKSYRCEIGVTDAEGLTARRSAMVHVAAVASGGWETLLDLDLTDLDSATLTAGSTTTITRDSVAVADVKVLNYNLNNGTVTTGASGIHIAGNLTVGHMAAGIDLEDHLSLTLPDDVLSDIVVHLYFDGLTGWTGSSDAWQAGIIKDADINISGGDDLSLRGSYSAAGLQNRYTSTNDGTSLWVTAEAIPAGAWVVSVLLRGGQIAEGWYTTGDTAPNDATIDAGGRVFAHTIAAGGTRWAASVLWAVARSIFRPDFYWTRMVVKRRL